ncbi:lysophospholipid acyltransferase 5-like [Saccostrea echinata]|uniref:lysophospholipid acyltransferase 5-like n=1 Tax=Saccostrea echinata TaxID=191078 RepID=UPI002A7EE566|nr:lysophospholipid acyltransferase 5-like [Saccostrea echinata]
MLSDVVSALASQIGASVQATSFLLSLFIGYPLGFLHRAFIHGKHENIHHLYFTLTGVAVYYFNFGLYFIHPLINIIVICVLLRVTGGSRISVAIAFIFNSGYLLYGYLQIAKEGYAITWSTPHCVLTLRLTALVIDYYDGKKSKDKLSKDQKENYISDLPSLLAMCGHSFFVGGMLAGPQFGMRKYLAFTRGEFSALMAKDASKEMQNYPPASVGPALTRLSLGLLYIVLFQTGNILFTDDFFFTPQYQDLRLLTKCAYILVWGQLHFRKYVGIWLICEGICILMGLSYNGKDENGNILWDGVTNVKLYQLETCSTFKGAIEAFNHNTNNWMFRYIYKRLQFLGNRLISQAVTLVYLALWHGLASGYYMNFFLEFIMVNTENQIMVLEYKISTLHELNRSITLQPFLWLVKKILVSFSISYALVSFCMLTYDKFLPIYSSVGYAGHVIYLGFPILYMFLTRVILTSKKPVNKTS